MNLALCGDHENTSFIYPVTLNIDHYDRVLLTSLDDINYFIHHKILI